MSEFSVVIPARYASERLPGKPLLPIAGKPMLEHVWERATESGAADIVIATDDQRVAEAARAFGADVCMTDAGMPAPISRPAEQWLRKGVDVAARQPVGRRFELVEFKATPEHSAKCSRIRADTQHSFRILFAIEFEFVKRFAVVSITDVANLAEQDSWSLQLLFMSPDYLASIFLIRHQ